MLLAPGLYAPAPAGVVPAAERRLLEALGCVRANTVLVHGVAFSPADWALIVLKDAMPARPVAVKALTSEELAAAVDNQRLAGDKGRPRRGKEKCGPDHVAGDCGAL